MNRRFNLAAVLRVRQIRADLAAAQAAEAAARTRSAVRERARREAELAGRPPLDSAAGVAWLAARSSALARAGEVLAGRAVVVARTAEEAAAVARLAAAHRDREGVAHLAERHAEQWRREQDAAEQRAADDRAGRRGARRGEEEQR
jgi:hypothetical protein